LQIQLSTPEECQEEKTELHTFSRRGVWTIFFLGFVVILFIVAHGIATQGYFTHYKTVSYLTEKFHVSPELLHLVNFAPNTKIQPSHMIGSSFNNDFSLLVETEFISKDPSPSEGKFYLALGEDNVWVQMIVHGDVCGSTDE
jgi:hypothetical protein